MKRFLQRGYGWRLGIAAVLLAAAVSVPGTGAGADDDDALTAVFTMTNDADGNELAVFARDDKGELAKPVFVPTGGTGTSAELGSQGSLALGHDGKSLYVVNAGSNSITVFHLGRRARPVQVVDSGGVNPISLTVSHDLLYVANAGGAVGDVDSICGFEIGDNGRLRPLRGSAAYLSAEDAGPGQIGFSPGGDVLTVTEKNTNTITLFEINKNGLPVNRALVASKGPKPFGFGYTRTDLLVVSEATNNAASSYGLDPEKGTLTAISASVPTNLKGTCWIATTHNGAFAYAADAASNAITGYSIGAGGKIAALDENGVTAETGAHPIDMTVLGNRTLFGVNSVDGTVGVYEIGNDGALTPRQVIGGLPLTHPQGLVVR